MRRATWSCTGKSIACDSSVILFFFQAEDGIRDLVRSRGLGDVYKRQHDDVAICHRSRLGPKLAHCHHSGLSGPQQSWGRSCLLYTSDAADERSSVDLGGRRIIKKKKRSTTI